MNRKFEIDIEGIFCEVPHSGRKLIVSCNTDLKDQELLVILHQLLCETRNKLKSECTPESLAMVKESFQRFQFGNYNGHPLKECKTQIKGSGTLRPGSKLNYSILSNLKRSELILVLFESICILRNKLSQEMTRDELAELAELHNIFHFGMRKEEEPFIVR